MEPLAAKHLLTPVRGTMEHFFYADWNMNIYRGCSHGCIYCDSRSACYGIQDFDAVRPKADALRLLESELRGKRKTGVVTMGAMSDPYNPLEAQLALTRGALTRLKRYGFGAAFTTKSALCARDADLLAEISRSAPVCARLTITCADDNLCLRVEPRVSPSSARFAAIRTLADAGVYAGVWLNPLLPYINDTEDNVRRIVQMTADAGGRFVHCYFGMTLRTGNREYYFQALERDFPGLREYYLRDYGNAYEIPAREPQTLYDALAEECAKRGLHWRFPDINREMFAHMPLQTSFL